MKKVILSAALVIAAFAGAQAQGGPVSYNGAYNVVVNDYLTMSPSGSFGTAGPITFNNPTEMQNGQFMPGANMIVEASRSWNVTVTVGSFIGGNAGSTIAHNIPAGNIMTVRTHNGTNGTNTLGGYIAAPAAPYNVANSNGGLNKTFTIDGMLTPGFAQNMSGSYTAAIDIIASLD